MTFPQRHFSSQRHLYDFLMYMFFERKDGSNTRVFVLDKANDEPVV